MPRILLIACVLGLAPLGGCGHDELDFDLPDGGRARPPRDASLDCDAAGPCSDAGAASAVEGGSSTDGAGGSATDLDTRPTSASRNDGQANAVLDADPDGYPTTAGHWAPWCQDKLGFEELCGTDIDEDCDGTVDEFEGLGSPCASGCFEGVYVCDPRTSSLFCQGASGCTNSDVWQPCGDGVVGSDEECDPAADGEHAGVTCTLDCRRPLPFVRCVIGGVPDPLLCRELYLCNEHVGACVPVIGPWLPRCPKLPVEGGADGESYPMLETEDGQCLITCSEPEQCPSSLSDCYMGFCAVPL